MMNIMRPLRALLLALITAATASLLPPRATPPPRRAPHPSLSAAGDDAPRGFGGFGGFAVDDLISEFDEEDAAAGAILPSELRAKRNKILLKWSDFVRTAGASGEPAEPLAALRNVSVGFGVLQGGVSWEVCEGQIVGVVGESGCGKSTQLKLLAGELVPSSGAVWRADESGLVAHVPQGVLAELAGEERTLREFVHARAASEEAEAATWRWLGWREEDEEEEAAAEAGRSLYGHDAITRRVCDLSSGQQLRLTLSIALATNPALLLCDEPTNHLDLSGLAWLEGVLNQAVANGIVGAAIAVSHDRAFLETACTHTLDAGGGGATLYTGSYSSYLRAKRTRAEALEQRQEEGEEEGGGEAVLQPAADAKKRPSRFRFRGSGKRRSGGGGEEGADMLVLRDVNVRACGDGSSTASSSLPILLDGVSLSVSRGEVVLLVGPNGAGKSSLMKAAAGYTGAMADADGGGGVRHVAEGVRLFVFAQDAAERLQGGQTAAEALRAAMDDRRC